MAGTESPAIACNLGALSSEERSRREALAHSIVAQAEAVQELQDGYALQFSFEPSLAHETLEWLLLERRCCRFFRLELQLEPDNGPFWLRLRGGPGVKDFLASAGVIPHQGLTASS